MKENVKEELDCLKQMVLNWRRGYLGWVEDGDNKWLIQELKDDIQEHMAPYINRFIEVEHITLAEGGEFWNDITESVRCFAEDIKKPPKKHESVDIKGLFNQFSIHADLVQGGHCDNETVVNQKLKIAKIALTLIPALMGSQCTCGEDVINSKCGGCDEVG